MSQVEIRPEASGEQDAVVGVVRRAFGAPLVVLEGAPGLYARHGYVPAGSLGLERPSERIPRPACQVRPLTSYDDSLTGRIVYPDVFWRFDAVGLRGETLAMVEAALADREAGAEAEEGTT